MSTYTRYHTITWDQLHKDCRELAARAQALGKFKGLVAIARGGLVPAAIVARELGIRHVESLCVVSYDWQNQDAEGCVMLNKLDSDGEGWLIIDDMVDTGRTAKAVRAALPKAPFLTLYAKPAGRPFVDDFITEVSQETWILMPWDSSVQFVPPLTEQNKTDDK